MPRKGATGLIRGMDKQRRVVIPQEALVAAGCEVGDMVEVYSELSVDDVPVITIRKFVPGCYFCGDKLPAENGQLQYRGKRVCIPCIRELISKARRLLGAQL